MTDSPVTRFLLELQLDTKPPRAVMSDVTTGDATASTNIALGAPPYELGLAFAADGPSGGLRPQLTTLTAIPEAPPRPFDPALVGDDGVLAVDWHLEDRRLETQDTSVLHLTLFNRSSYFAADQLVIRLRVKASDGSEPGVRPDGNDLVTVSPAVQSTRRIEPKADVTFTYLVVTRGPRAGLYTLAVEADYQLVYILPEEARSISAVASLPLRIHGGSVPALPGSLVPPAADPRFEPISMSQRRLHMPDQGEGEYGHSRRRELHAIERKVILPGGGEIIVCYRLVKGSHGKPDETRCSFGYNPSTKEIESYFSTSDEADMEITLRNQSGLHLRHIYLKDVQLFNAKEDGGHGAPADKDRLPDGNYLFQVLPNDVYFGHLEPGETRIRYLGLITRGTRPGKFLVNFEVKYEIVEGHQLVDLPLFVNPD
jgi:hypothetical protein